MDSHDFLFAPIGFDSPKDKVQLWFPCVRLSRSGADWSVLFIIYSEKPRDLDTKISRTFLKSLKQCHIGNAMICHVAQGCAD